MARFHGSVAAYLLIILVCLSVGAFATPITGSGFTAPHSFSSDGGKLYNSSLSGGVNEQNHLRFTAGNSGGGFAPHRFSLQVPPPRESETPEPSTLTLFGSGLMMVGAAVRRKFGR